MKLSSFEYFLPKELIANEPITPRDHSKLMVVDRGTNTIRHKRFYELFDVVRHSDVLVLNDTKVFPARVFGKKETGGNVEALFLKEVSQNIWEILGKNIPPVGCKMLFTNFYAIVREKRSNVVKVEVYTNENNLMNLLILEGKTPVPPYINAGLPENKLRRKYQTVYAKKRGSVAAPTAGFHFTNRLMAKLKRKGVLIQYVTLHVGLGTFAPVRERDIAKHKMHSEHYSVSEVTYEIISKAKSEGRRIVAVGTTTARVLETVANTNRLSGETDIFIYPPYRFRLVDALITNFHLPHSTLLAMVSAFVSEPNTSEGFKDFKSSLAGKAYSAAIDKKYRFYSFGDGMFIV